MQIRAPRGESLIRGHRVKHATLRGAIPRRSARSAPRATGPSWLPAEFRFRLGNVAQLDPRKPEEPRQWLWEVDLKLAPLRLAADFGGGVKRELI